MTVDIATCIILCGINRWLCITNKSEVCARHPDTKPLITTCSFLAVGAVAKNLIYGIASKLETNLATLTTTFSHLFFSVLKRRLNDSKAIKPRIGARNTRVAGTEPDYMLARRCFAF